MGAVRFLKNIHLTVQYDDGTESSVPFASGDTWKASKIESDELGYNNIYMPDGGCIVGVASEIFENMGKKVPVVNVVSVEPEESEEIDVDAEPVKPTTLDGTIRSDDDYDVYESETQ